MSFNPSLIAIAEYKYHRLIYKTKYKTLPFKLKSSSSKTDSGEGLLATGNSL